MDPQFWNGKNVLVTGHTGFKGSWLSLLLSGFGANVHGFSLEPPTRQCLYEIADIPSRLASSRIADIRNHDQISDFVKQVKPDVILHLAAQSLVGLSYEDPVGTYATNVMGTVNLLDAARLRDEPCIIVNVTTDKCYENREWVWPYREDEPMGGHDPYSNSKGCSELVTSAFRNSFLAEKGIALASARAGNVIGGGDWADKRLVPDILRAHDEGKELEIRNPFAIRPWQHVLEPLGGYLLLAEQLHKDQEKFQGAWNFGPSEEDIKNVRWIAERTLKHLNSSIRINVFEPEFHEANLLKLDSSKARMVLGWQPRWNVDKALLETANWHLAYQSKADMQEFCDSQISTYIQTSIEE